ncbi:AraC family transcriptional regulator [Kitasatospora sp. NPDC048194]|uniref:AraC family transcriptional regulator n=1 Tax=Kitasatospora sp. NPDC048194 TaxID=3364045 RepID=UPI0037220677
MTHPAHQTHQAHAADPAEPDDGTPGPVALYRGSCLDELRRIVSGRLSSHHLTVPGRQQPAGCFRVYHEGGIGFYDLSYGAEVRLRIEELPDFYSVVLPFTGGLRVRANGVELPGAPFVAGPGDQVAMEWDSRARNGALAVRRETVEQALAVRLGDLPRQLPRFRHHLDPADPAVLAWVRLARQFAEFAVSPLAQRSPLGLQHFEKLLVDGLLDAQPHSFSGPSADGARAVLPSALRRATAYCDEHAHEPISVGDIAQAARVGTRALREGFRTHLGTTPLAYLREVRLERVHRELLAIAGGRASGTVTEVACRWGFTHLGRFSAAYRRTFGHPPSRTVGRGA